MEKTEAIKIVNRKYSKTQPVEKPFILEEGGMTAYYKGFGRFLEAIYNVLFIVPVVVMALLEGISHGILKGLQRATSAYEKRVGRG